ncbi:GP63-like [Trichomonas vaginalis G3]|uniref:GP63-like n=1 Tax=Trichomonas vaginalis (strain ATCC PRA-98 / G3) TaxID=412133 RepID=A2E6F7_TRIV3|nr:regulation of choline O-acetyltransferase protein [Trichomonas vaginalis G3]EAY11770.1 GP63-like [Trichomonas vaginalis G3]KAI5540639.1 regulation of choline O-acetyltransferase protein [Trichomonas vaginalis G3]|eukprot:XP_001323993.1 GP63-like [Trichomonas vaginalis G3]
MILLFLFFGENAARTKFYHVCGHQSIQDKEAISVMETTIADSFEPIRIKFSVTPDTLSCAAASGSVSWNGVNYTCEADDVLSAEKKTALETTLGNVNTYLSKLLKVRRLKDKITLKNYKSLTTSLGSGDNAEVSDIDLVVNVIPRPSKPNLEQIALTAITQIENQAFRPVQAVMFVNTRYLPTTASNIDSDDDRFFYTLLHESLHACGISASLYDRYHPLNTSTPHENIVLNATWHTKLNTGEQQREYSFLVTPKAHQFAINHYNITYITYGKSSVVSGIELETTEGIEKSHPEAMRFQTDVMTGFIMEAEKAKFSRVTDVTLAMLLDTGFYNVDYTQMQPIIYGNSRSVNGNPNPDYGQNLPQLKFPKGTFYEFSDSWDTTMFDFKHSGTLDIDSLGSANCAENHFSDTYCSATYFYNPMGYFNVTMEPTYDWALIKIPTTNCPNGKAFLPGNDTECGTYSCAANNSSYMFTYKGESNAEKTITCTKEDETYTSFKRSGEYPYTLKCADPVRFCNTVKQYESKFTSDPLYEYTPPGGGGGTPTPSGGSGGSGGGGGGGSELTDKQKKIIIIASVCGGVFLIILIASICWYQHTQKDEDDEDNDDKSTSDLYSSNSI